MGDASRKYSADGPPKKRRCHNLKAITIPNVEMAFEELGKFDPEVRAPTRRERALGKILVDTFQLRVVDLAAILKIASIISAVPKDVPVAIVFYAGESHSREVTKFFRSQGFSHQGLPGKGHVGKTSWTSTESRALAFPAYLRDFRQLFSAT